MLVMDLFLGSVKIQSPRLEKIYFFIFLAFLKLIILVYIYNFSQKNFLNTNFY